MADFASPTPFEPEKATFLHERAERPAPPDTTALVTARRLAGVVLSVLFAAGFVALLYQTRASWAGHRDFVVPITIPLASIAGVAVGMLIVRGQVMALLPGMGLLFVALLLIGANIWRGEVVDGSDAFRNALSIITAVLLGFAALAFTIGLIWAEVAHPIKAPVAEM